MNKSHWIAFAIYSNATIAILIALYFFLIPFALLISDLRDKGLQTGQIPQVAFRTHRLISADYETWARARVASGTAAGLSTADISGTEWPIFSSVYYLWATEALQQAWEADPSLAAVMPKVYAEGAIEAAAELISDPNHATWVKAHWGDDYLTRENIFYRMLLISGLTSYQTLSGNPRYQTMLAEQVTSLAHELDASPYGLLDDYPNQCYPIDILPAIAAIQRADTLLGSDHAEIIGRAVRGFEEERLDPLTQLPAYVADSQTGQGRGPARGVGISYMLIWAPEVWPTTAAKWYPRYETHFWQEDWLIAGVRELSRHTNYREWFLEVDAGPVVAGYGTAATAFGIGAARANGRFDHAYPVTAEALVAAWPLPHGTMLGARLLSNLSDAPYTGEFALLFNLTRQPLVNTTVPPQKGLPTIVYIALGLYLAVGLIIIRSALRSWRHWSKNKTTLAAQVPPTQLALWGTFMLGGGLSLMMGYPLAGIFLLVCGQCWPRYKTNP